MWNKHRERNGSLDPVIHLGVLEGEKKQSICCERRWEVMFDGGRVKARKAKEKDSPHCFICLGVG